MSECQPVRVVDPPPLPVTTGLPFTVVRSSASPQVVDPTAKGDGDAIPAHNAAGQCERGPVVVVDAATLSVVQVDAAALRRRRSSLLSATYQRAKRPREALGRRCADRFENQEVPGRPPAEGPPRELPKTARRVGKDDVPRRPALEDDEVSCAEPHAQVGDRRQRAPRNRVVRGSDASRLETETLRNLRQSDEIRPVTVEPELSRQVLAVESAPVIPRYGRKSGETAVVMPPLTYEPTS